MAQNLRDMLISLAKEGCYPSIYRRGDLWRAHVNAAGNYWEDDKSPTLALRRAMEAWKEAGKPMDGMADTVSARNE